MAWLGVLCLTGYHLTQDTIDQLANFNENKTVTEITLLPFEETPFPAVIVSLGGSIDPMGHIRHSGDIVTQDDLSKDGGEYTAVLLQNDLWSLKFKS